MNKLIKVSIIIATYKRDVYLFNCLKSLIQSFMSNFEIIVVDDGGGLNRNIEVEFKKLNVKWLYLPENIGQPGAQAEGVRIAEGEILVFLDDDAVVDKNWINSITDYFEKYSKINTVVGRILPIEDKHILSKMRQTIYDQRNENYLSLKFRDNLIKKYSLKVEKNILISDHVSGGNFAIKREFYNYINGFCIEFRRNNDHDFSKRILKAGYCIGYNPNMIIYHHHNKGYLVLFKNMILDGRNYVKMLPKGSKFIDILNVLINIVFVPFKIIKFKGMLNADKNKVKVYIIYTFLQYLEGLGRILQVFCFN